MTLQRTTFEYLAAIGSVTDAVPSARWYRRGAQVDRSQVPYVVFGWNGNLATSGRITPQSLDLYVHDELGSYKRIGDIHKAFTEALQAVAQYVGTSGVRLVQADFLGYSEEGVDQGNSTSYQFSSWKILGGAA